MLRQHSVVIREQAAAAHYAWIAGFLGSAENCGEIGRKARCEGTGPSSVVSPSTATGASWALKSGSISQWPKPSASGSIEDLERVMAELPNGVPGDGFYCEVEAEN